MRGDQNNTSSKVRAGGHLSRQVVETCCDLRMVRSVDLLRDLQSSPAQRLRFVVSPTVAANVHHVSHALDMSCIAHVIKHTRTNAGGVPGNSEEEKETEPSETQTNRGGFLKQQEAGR